MKSQQALPLSRHFSHFYKEWAFVVKVHQSIIDENSCSDISKAVRTGLNLIFISFGCQMSTPAALITNFRSSHDKTLVWNGNIYLTNNRPFMRWGSLHCFCRVDKQWFQSQRCRRSPAHAANLFSATFGAAGHLHKRQKTNTKRRKTTTCSSGR